MAPPLSAGLTIKSLSVLSLWIECSSCFEMFGVAGCMFALYSVLRSWYTFEIYSCRLLLSGSGAVNLVGSLKGCLVTFPVCLK